MRPGQTTVIDANQRFAANVDVKGSVEINSIGSTQRAVWQGTSLTLNDTNLNLPFAQNDQLNVQANNLKSALLDQAVFKNQPEINSGSKLFSSGVSVHQLSSDLIHVTRVKNNSLTVLPNDLVYKDSNLVTVRGKKSVPGADRCERKTGCGLGTQAVHR